MSKSLTAQHKKKVHIIDEILTIVKHACEYTDLSLSNYIVNIERSKNAEQHPPTLKLIPKVAAHKTRCLTAAKLFLNAASSLTINESVRHAFQFKQEKQISKTSVDETSESSDHKKKSRKRKHSRDKKSRKKRRHR